MEVLEPQPEVQHRATFRTSLLPAEIQVSRLWIHEPEVRFIDAPPGPEKSVLSLSAGVSLLNISAGGSLVRIATPPSVGLLRLVAQQIPEEEKGGKRATPSFRDVSLVLRIDLRKDLRDILVSGKIVRTTLLRTTSQASFYELALRFYSWGNLTGPSIQWYRVRDGSVPPIAAWITRRQLSKTR